MEAVTVEETAEDETAGKAPIAPRGEARFDEEAVGETGGLRLETVLGLETAGRASTERISTGCSRVLAEVWVIDACIDEDACAPGAALEVVFAARVLDFVAGLCALRATLAATTFGAMLCSRDPAEAGTTADGFVCDAFVCDAFADAALVRGEEVVAAGASTKRGGATGDVERPVQPKPAPCVCWGIGSVANTERLVTISVARAATPLEPAPFAFVPLAFGCRLRFEPERRALFFNANRVLNANRVVVRCFGCRAASSCALSVERCAGFAWANGLAPLASTAAAANAIALFAKRFSINI